jgi:RNA polymerase sigma-70 factor, ECF subfamily
LASQHELNDTEQLLARLEQGDASALGQLVARHRAYVKRVIDLRMDDGLRGRVDPSDVVQETQMVVTQRIDDFLLRRPTTFRIWLRRKTLEKLIDLRRRHFAERRSVKRDVRLSDASSLAIVRQLLAGDPGEAMQRQELAQQVGVAIRQLSELDREVLLMRHVEELSNTEVAELLEIDPPTARKRHGRAIRRLGERLRESGVSLEE